MGVSAAQGRCAALVIMARIVWPPRLNLFVLSATAGRLFWPTYSENGNGTTTTSHCSEITESFLVLAGMPLIEAL
jgi:hypothetical protein